MVCYTGKSNQLKPLGDISGVSLSCIAPLSGFFLGDNLVKHIPLTQGKFAIVDDEDYDYLMQWKWFAAKDKNTYYAKRNQVVAEIKFGEKRTTLSMHRIIMKTPIGMEVDHRDHNGINNRKKNMRNCSHMHNLQNKISIIGTSQYKGVYKRGCKWIAAIRHNRKIRHIGIYLSEETAAKAYDEKAVECFGAFAHTNF